MTRWKRKFVSCELLSIQDALADPIVMAVMEADGVEAADLEALLSEIAAKLNSRTDNLSRSRSRSR